MRVAPFFILFSILPGLIQVSAQYDRFGRLDGIRFQSNQHVQHQRIQNSASIPQICQDINWLAAFGETDAAVKAAVEYLKSTAQVLAKSTPSSDSTTKTPMVTPRITPEQFSAFLLWHNLSDTVHLQLQKDDDPVCAALVKELFGSPDDAADLYREILTNGPANPGLFRRWAVVAAADPNTRFAETLQDIDPRAIVANGDFLASQLFQQITDYSRRLDLATGIAASLEKHEPISDPTKLYWASNLMQMINSSYQDESSANPWHLRELRRRNSINQGFASPEHKQLAERRITVFKKLCESLMRHPAMAPSAFSYWAILTEHGRLTTEDVWARAEQLLLGERPKDQACIQTSNLTQTGRTRIPYLLPAEQIFRFSRTDSPGTRVRFQKTLDTLNTGHTFARATGALLSSMAKLAGAEPEETETEARNFLALATADLVSADPMTLVETLTDGKGGYDALALLRYQLSELKRIPDQIPNRVMMALTGSSNPSGNNNKSDGGADGIRKLLEEIVDVAKEASEPDKNRTQNALVNLLSTFAGRMETAWTAVELCSGLDLPLNIDPIQGIENAASSYRLDDNVTRTETFLKNAPVFRDGEAFRIYPSQYLSRQTVLGFLLYSMRSKRSKAPIYTKILKEMKPAFGRDLALAYLKGGSRPYPTVLRFCETNRNKIEKLTDTQQEHFVFFLNNISGKSSRDVKKMRETLDFLPWQSPPPFGLAPERFLALKNVANINSITNGYPIENMIVQWLPALRNSPDKTQAVIEKYWSLPQQQRQGGSMPLVLGLLNSPDSASHFSLGLDQLERAQVSTGFANLESVFRSRWADLVLLDPSTLEDVEKIIWLLPTSLTGNPSSSAKWDRAFGKLGALRAALRDGGAIPTTTTEFLRGYLENADTSLSQRAFVATRMLNNPAILNHATVVNVLLDYLNGFDVAAKYPELLSDQRLWTALGTAKASASIAKLVETSFPSLSKSGYLRNNPITTALLLNCASKHGVEMDSIEEICEASTLAHGELLAYFVSKQNHREAFSCLKAMGANPPTRAPTTRQSITPEAAAAFLETLPDGPVRQFGDTCLANLRGDPEVAAEHYLAIVQEPESSTFLKRLALTWAVNNNPKDVVLGKLMTENSGDLPFSALTPLLYHSCGAVASMYVHHSLHAALRHDPDAVVRYIAQAEKAKRYRTESINHLADNVANRFQNPANLGLNDVNQMVPVLLRCIQVPRHIPMNQRHSLPTMAVAAVLVSGETDQFNQWFEALPNDERRFLAQRISGENILSWVSSFLSSPAFKDVDRSAILEAYFSNPLVLSRQVLQPDRDDLEPLMESGLINEEVLLEKGDWLVEQVPQKERIFAAIGRIAQQKGEYEKAAEAWARAAAETPQGRNDDQSSQYHLAAAQSWLQLNRPHATLDWLQWHHPGSTMSDQSEFDSVFDQCVEVLVSQDGTNPLWHRSRKLLSRDENDGFALRLAALLFAREAVVKLAAGENDLAVALASTAQRLAQLIESPNAVLQRTENVFRSTNSYPTEQIDLIIPRNSRWSYLSEGEFPDQNWTKPGFDVSSWPSGHGILGYNESELNTSIGFGDDSDNKPVTTYFRHEFGIPKLSEIKRLILRIRHDDAVVCYINGHEVARNNLPDGPITADVRALQTRSGDVEDEYWEKIIPSSVIVQGVNVIAVEIHQQSPDSSDHSFDLDLGWLIAPSHGIAKTKETVGAYANHLPPTVWDAVGKVELPRRITGNSRNKQRVFRSRGTLLDSGIQLLR